MISGAQLAALDHNHNIDRPQVHKNIKEGIPIPRFKISYSKPSKRFVAKKVKTEKSYHYLRDIASDIYYRSQSNNEKDRASRKRSICIAPIERPDREEIIELHTKYSRM